MSNFAAAPVALAERVWSVCSYRDKLVFSHGNASYKLSVYQRQHHPSEPLLSISVKRPVLNMRFLAKWDAVLCVDEEGIALWKSKGNALFEEVARTTASQSVTRPIAISLDETRVAAGTDSGLIEVWAMEKTQDCFHLESTHKSLSDPISGLSFSKTHDVLAVTSGGELPGCHILDRVSGQVLHTLYFSEHEGEPNFSFVGCVFSRSSDILYTCQSLPQCPAYITQWDPKTEYSPISTHKVHDSPASKFQMSRLGFTIAVGTESGAVLTVNTRTLGIESVEDLLPRRVTALDFSADGRVIVTGSEDGTVKCVYNQYMVGLFSRATKGWMIFLMLAWVYFYVIS